MSVAFHALATRQGPVTVRSWHMPLELQLLSYASRHLFWSDANISAFLISSFPQSDAFSLPHASACAPVALTMWKVYLVCATPSLCAASRFSATASWSWIFYASPSLVSSCVLVVWKDQIQGLSCSQLHLGRLFWGGFCDEHWGL